MDDKYLLDDESFAEVNGGIDGGAILNFIMARLIPALKTLFPDSTAAINALMSDAVSIAPEILALYNKLDRSKSAALIREYWDKF